MKTTEKELDVFNERSRTSNKTRCLLQHEDLHDMKTHGTSECFKGKDFWICSECGHEGHTWKDCTKEGKT